MQTRTAIKQPASRASKRQRAGTQEEGDGLTVEQYLTAFCDGYVQDIQRHADKLVAHLRSEYEAGAARLRADADVSTKDASRIHYKLTLRCHDGPYKGSTWQFDLTQGQTIPIGRSKAKKFVNTGISLSKDHSVSTSHAKIELKEGRLLCTDIGSSNGTVLNEVEIDAHIAKDLKTSDVLVIGDTAVIVAFEVNPSA